MPSSAVVRSPSPKGYVNAAIDVSVIHNSAVQNIRQGLLILSSPHLVRKKSAKCREAQCQHSTVNALEARNLLGYSSLAANVRENPRSPENDYGSRG